MLKPTINYTPLEKEGLGFSATYGADWLAQERERGDG